MPHIEQHVEATQIFTPPVSSWTRGLVIGKFHPPHRGHSYLISSAAQIADEVDVLVCQRHDQTIPGELRAQWLREMHPEANVMVVEDPGSENDSAFWAAHTIKILGHKPDIVFSSEKYGARYAELMGCRHVMVDLDRQHVPISATEIRENIFAHWEHLPAPVRAYYAQRVCIVGAESSGTSVMSRLLADHYQTVWVPGYGRDYSETRIIANGDNAPWRSAEFYYIARQQQFYEDVFARNANKVLFCDSDALSISLWHERYMKKRSEEIALLAANRNYAHYFVMHGETVYTADPQREWLYKRILAELKRTGCRFTVLDGGIEQRMMVATSIVDELLKGK